MNLVGSGVGFICWLLLGGGAFAQTAFAPNKDGVVSVGFAGSGVIKAFFVRNGDHIEKGQALAELDCLPLQKDIDFRAASLAAAEAAFERVRNGPRPEEIAIGEAVVRDAKARAVEARAARSRAEALQPGVTITIAQLLAVQRDSGVADAQLVDAMKQLALLQAGSRAEDIAEAKAKRDAAAAYLDEGHAELDQCSIQAPVSGTVQLTATVGQPVSIYAPMPVAQITIESSAK
jgi:HlyD family secretion protein